MWYGAWTAAVLCVMLEKWHKGYTIMQNNRKTAWDWNASVKTHLFTENNAMIELLAIGTKGRSRCWRMDEMTLPLLVGGHPKIALKRVAKANGKAITTGAHCTTFLIWKTHLCLKVSQTYIHNIKQDGLSIRPIIISFRLLINMCVCLQV